MPSVSDLLDREIEIEGGFVNNHVDRGGPTKYGITQKTLSIWLGRPATIAEVQLLTKEEAKNIYTQIYVKDPKINTLPELLQPQLVDMSINSGPKRAVEMLQTVLSMAGYDCTTDGFLGPDTLLQGEKAAQDMGPYLVNAVEEYREQFYQELVANDPTQQVFLAGWLRRARAFRLTV